MTTKAKRGGGALIPLFPQNYRVNWLFLQLSGVSSLLTGATCRAVTSVHKLSLTNPSTTYCVMIEVQSGGYVGEDDTARFDYI